MTLVAAKVFIFFTLVSPIGFAQNPAQGTFGAPQTEAQLDAARMRSQAVGMKYNILDAKDIATKTKRACDRSPIEIVQITVTLGSLLSMTSSSQNPSDALARYTKALGGVALSPEEASFVVAELKKCAN